MGTEDPLSAEGIKPGGYNESRDGWRIPSVALPPPTKQARSPLNGAKEVEKIRYSLEFEKNFAYVQEKKRYVTTSRNIAKNPADTNFLCIDLNFQGSASHPPARAQSRRREATGPGLADGDAGVEMGGVTQNSDTKSLFFWVHFFCCTPNAWRMKSTRAT